PKGRYLQASTDFNEVCGLPMNHVVRCHAPAPNYCRGPWRLGPRGYRYTKVGGGCGLRKVGRIYCFDPGQTPSRYRIVQFAGGGFAITCWVRANGELHPKCCGPK
ncbi:MAG TPA: hypothetical protein VFB34_00730, partial [Chloroflexota bacterium]|nr:hypothetical protein [Chloroflexota bacterium]